MASDAVNLRRLTRALESLVRAPREDRRAAARLREYACSAQRLHERLGARLEEPEQLALGRKLALFAEAARERAHVLERAPELGPGPSAASAAVAEPGGGSRDNNSAVLERAISGGGIELSSIEAAAAHLSVAAAAEAAEFEGLQRELRREKDAAPSPQAPLDVEQARAEARRAAAVGLEAEPAPESERDRLLGLRQRQQQQQQQQQQPGQAPGTAAKLLQEQLERDRLEKQEWESKLAGMISQLKHKVIETNDKLREDSAFIDMHAEKMSKNLDFLQGISKRLNVSLNNTTFSCRQCTAGTALVLALWVLAYLVMRIFPKVRPAVAVP
jgi:hypothetical protein